MNLALLGFGQGWCKQVGGHPTLSREQLVDYQHQREHALASCGCGEQSLFREVMGTFDDLRIKLLPQMSTLVHTTVHERIQNRILLNVL